MRLARFAVLLSAMLLTLGGLGALVALGFTSSPLGQDSLFGASLITLLAGVLIAAWEWSR